MDYQSGFDIYAEYCNHSQTSNARLLKCQEASPEVAAFFKRLQEKLDHGLPLASYLLKPVQRILKYHLLLQALVKHFPEEDYGGSRRRRGGGDGGGGGGGDAGREVVAQVRKRPSA